MIVLAGRECSKLAHAACKLSFLSSHETSNDRGYQDMVDFHGLRLDITRIAVSCT